jgi:hypothetical protein
LWRKQMRTLGLSPMQASRATGRRYRKAPLEREAEQHERNHRTLSLARRRGQDAQGVSGLRRFGAGARSR